MSTVGNAASSKGGRVADIDAESEEARVGVRAARSVAQGDGRAASGGNSRSIAGGDKHDAG